MGRFSAAGSPEDSVRLASEDPAGHSSSQNDRAERDKQDQPGNECEDSGVGVVVPREGCMQSKMLHS